MTSSNSRGAYADCFELFDRALDSPKGIRVAIGTGPDAVGPATHLRQRLNKARVLDRDAMRRIYEHTDPKHGVSPYDTLVVRILSSTEDDLVKWWIYIVHRKVTQEVEELGAAE